VNMSNKLSPTAYKGDPHICGLGYGLTTSHLIKKACYEILHRTFVGSCEHGNEPFGSIKGREFLD
jgi:hypothetical protein